MARRGRPPLPRGIRSFEASDWQPPEAILLDTTIVVDALLPSQKNHQACVAFFDAVAQRESTLVFNRLLETELCEVLFNIAGREQHGKDWKRARYDGRVRRRANRLLEEGLQAWAELLDAVTWTRLELGFRADLHRTEVGMLERGIRLPRIDTLVKVADSLGVRPAELLVGLTWTPRTAEGGGFTFGGEDKPNE